MDLLPITLVSFGYFEREFLEKVAGSVSSEFHMPVNIKEGHLDLSEYYDPPRRQYNGNALLRHVDTMAFPDSLKVIGLFSVDLCIPILTFIFGQALLGGNTGIASLFRLGNERYGLAPDKKILLERCIKEVIHELGHTFGLIHCLHPTCVMRSSTYVEDIDLKELHFCIACRSRLEIH